MTATKKRRTPTMIIAAVLALALVGGAAFLVVNFLRGSTPAATRGIPAEAVAVIELNLNPAVADQLALKEFIEKFPSLADDSEPLGDNYKEALWNLIPDDPDKPDFAEVEPWLGDSLAIGMMPPGPDPYASPEGVFAIEVTDQAAAEAFFAEHATDAHISFADGLVVISDPESAVDAQQTVDASLADTDIYAADMDALGGGFLVTAWFSPELPRIVAEGSGAGPGEMFDDIPATHGAVGFKVEDGAAVLRVVTSTEDMVLHDGEDIRSFTEALPNGILVFSAALPEEQMDEAWEMLQQTPDLRETMDMLDIRTADDLKAVLGSRIGATVSFENDDVIFGLAVDTEDPERHSSVVNQLLAEAGMPEIQHEVIDGIAYTTYGMSPSEAADPANPVGDNEHFSSLTEVSGDASSIGFVDVNALESVLPDINEPVLEEIVRTISGVGISQSVLNDEYAEVIFRIGTN